MDVLIDDGGAAILPDGALIYLALWDRPCPKDSSLTYTNFAQGFFGDYCLRCHSDHPTDTSYPPPPNLHFDSLDAVRTYADAIFGAAADENVLMPPFGAVPTSEQRHALGDWLACGLAEGP